MISISEAIEAARQHAPYLADSLDYYPLLAERLKTETPVDLRDSLYAELPLAVGSLDEEMKLLRRLKRQAHLMIALADIAQIWSWVEVTESLTRLADIAMQRILTAAAREQNIEGQPNNPAPGLFILAVGKYGARELNYSSDIDFNVFYDPEKIVVPNPARAERTLVKLVQNLVRGLEAITQDGYIFRTDLRLRPDPRSNAVAVSVLSAERYYETIGQNWERAAMIKARVCGGDIEAGQDFRDNVLAPFIWRRNLDYAAIEDILAIKRQINSRLGQKDLNISGHHLKLGLGGIREIEFYAQVQQLILGGRHKALRSPRTVDALAALVSAGFVKADNAKALTAHYGKLRKLEHVAQMVRDEQTHLVPEDETKRLSFSVLAGFQSMEEMEGDVREILLDVRQRYSELFPNAEPLASDEGNMVFTGIDPDPGTLAVLRSHGFADPENVWHRMADWLGGRIRATRTERARELLTILAPKIIEYCADTNSPDLAFDAFGAFFTKLTRGVSLLSMFHQRPQHMRDVINLMVKSPVIAETIAEKPAILDALSDPRFLIIRESDFAEGANLVSSSVGFEEAMNASRRWVREEKFRISAALLSGRVSPQRAGELFSDLGDKAIQTLLPFAIADVERRFGKIQGEVGVLGLGKLASREMTLNSDLDIMLIYRPGTGEENVQHIYARITQRLISALSAITEEGGLYEVDMALRPSGRKGPVAVSADSFENYYAHKAWTWEFMALSRSRIICANSLKFENDLEQLRRTALMSEREDLSFAADIADMLRRIHSEKTAAHIWDLKRAQGGLRDIEFMAQKDFLLNRSAQLERSASMRDVLKSGTIAPKKDLQKLVNAFDLFMEFQQLFAVHFGETNISNFETRLNYIAKLLKFRSVEDMRKQIERHKSFVVQMRDKLIFEE